MQVYIFITNIYEIIKKSKKKYNFVMNSWTILNSIKRFTPIYIPYKNLTNKHTKRSPK